MKKCSCKKGFTLIELLVVVLIIGILAAIALPQYQYAVEKSRVASALQTMSILQKATDIWLLENGEPAADGTSLIGAASTASLDVEVTKSMNCSVWDGYGCATSDFLFSVVCHPHSYCYIDIWRIRNGNINDVLYTFTTERSVTDNNGWMGDECNYKGAGSLGERICNELVEQGKMDYACNDC